MRQDKDKTRLCVMRESGYEATEPEQIQEKWKPVFRPDLRYN
jgi:hypothetical protein